MNKDRVYLFFDRLTKFGLAGLLFFIPISNALIEIFAGLTLAGFIGKKVIRPDFQWLKHKQNILLVLFFIFMSLSLINSGQYIGTSLRALFIKWGKYIILSLIIQDSIRQRKTLYIYVGILIFSAGLVAISGITQFFGGVEFLRGRQAMVFKGGLRSITSSFNHPNGLGAYLIIPFTLCVAFLKSPSILKRRLYCLILFLVIILGFVIFHTCSRGTWFGVLAALIAMLFISRRFITAIPLIIFCGIILFIPGFREIFSSIFQFGGDSSRFLYWKGAVSMFAENPFLGKGVGTFMARFSTYIPNIRISYAHNCYLQIMAESGIFSLFAFLGFIFLALNNAIKKFFSEHDPILLGGACGLFGFLVHSFFEVNLYSLPLAVLFWLWIGIISVLGSERAAE